MHHVGILYGQFMMHGQRNIKRRLLVRLFDRKNKTRSEERVQKTACTHFGSPSYAWQVVSNAMFLYLRIL